jgi:hypothetical protein
VFKIEALVCVSLSRVGSISRSQSKSIEMKYKFILNLCIIIWYMFPIQCEELRINHLTPLLVVTMPYASWFLWWADYIEDFK